MERRKFTREFKLEAVKLIRERGVAVTQASHDLGVHQSQLRDWVKKFADDPQHSFPGHGQMKPEQLGEWPAGDRYVVEQQADLLFGWKPENVLPWLLSNPNGPDDKAEQELLLTLQGARSPEQAATFVLNEIYSRLQSENPALQPAASELS
jgi:hypothetical protein